MYAFAYLFFTLGSLWKVQVISVPTVWLNKPTAAVVNKLLRNEWNIDDVQGQVYIKDLHTSRICNSQWKKIVKLITGGPSSSCEMIILKNMIQRYRCSTRSFRLV